MAIKVFSVKNRYFNLFIICGLLMVIAAFSNGAYAEKDENIDMNQWLKARFSAQHQALIPIVAVADMLHGCQQEKQIDENVTIKSLITQLDKNRLAEKLISCLAGKSLKSDTALNYGLTSCSFEQLTDLPVEEKQQKMRLVTKAISELSRSERQKSFTHCVTEQAIHYLR
jgi:hypothetical protein